MLNLIKSNRMETLIEALCQVLAQVPDTPMAPEWIGIQSRGMRQWLSVSIARNLGVCANVAFLFPRQILENLAALSGNTDEMVELTRETMAWGILDLLMDEAAWPDAMTGEAGPGRYVQNDPTGRKTWQLSRHIAGVFDDYQVYRPDLLAQWESGQVQSDPVARWQAWLWKTLCRRQGEAAGLPRDAQAGATSGLPGVSTGMLPGVSPGLPPGQNLPARIFLFGVSAMPPKFLEAFAALADDLDVYLFMLSPTDQFFFDLGSVKQARKEAAAGRTDLLPESEGNPLLRALGRSGREFSGLLENFHYHEPLGDLFITPGQGADRPLSMLEVIQSDILNLVNRRAGSPDSPLPVDPQDRSLTLHLCHSPMREAQVVKDQVLAALAADTLLMPHDIIVMMPDIESYAPFLEAVFSQEPRLPFTVSDRRKRSELKLVEAFLTILSLNRSRLEKSRVMDLLRYPAVGEKFGLGATDQEILSEALADAGVFWGRDQEHRRTLAGLDFHEQSWQFGMDRLILGTMLPGGEKGLAGGILPCEGFEGLEADLLGRFAHFVATLFRSLDRLAEARTLAGWGRCLKQIARSMLSPESGQGDLVFLINALGEICQEGETAGFRRKIAFPVVEDAIISKLDQRISQGSFLAGSITLCNLMPMRSIPFKLICLMGMDEKSFPRQFRAQGFDLMARQPRLGDKNPREEDCYLFLESLISARQQMVITYTGKSIADNSPIPCAVPVAELVDAVAAGFTLPEAFSWIFDHPLHPFSPVYFDPDAGPRWFSFSASHCALARAQARRQSASEAAQGLLAVCRAGTFDSNPDSAGAPDSILLSPQDLIRFFRNPAQHFLMNRLGVRFPEMAAETREREAFQVEGLDLYTLGGQMLGATDDPLAFDRSRAGGRLPLGQKGKTEWERIRALAEPVARAAADLFPGADPEPLDISLDIGGFRFQGQVPDCYGQGRYVKTFGRLTPARLLTQWIFHLFYNAAASVPGETVLVGRDPKGSKPVATIVFQPVPDRAAEEILTLAELWQAGQNRLLPFACNPSHALVRSLVDQGGTGASDGEILEKALELARPLWEGSRHAAGAMQDRYTGLAYEGQTPFDTVETLKMSGFLDTGLAVFHPMMEYLAQ